MFTILGKKDTRQVNKTKYKNHFIAQTKQSLKESTQVTILSILETINIGEAYRISMLGLVVTFLM